MAIDTNIIFPPRSASNPGFNRYGSILTPFDLLSKYLFGVDFKNGNGTPLLDMVLQDSILSAISEFEHNFNLTLTPTTYTEPYDYDASDYNMYAFFQLMHRPVISLEYVKIKLSNSVTFVQFPQDWVRLNTVAGQVNIVPVAGSLTGFNIGNGGLLPKVYGVSKDFPQLFEIKYVAGFEQNKIPLIVNEWIGYKAALPLLMVAGDLVLGAGISSQSISFDGLSQSIKSNASGSEGAFGARITEYKEQLKELEKTIRKFYQGINLSVC